MIYHTDLARGLLTPVFFMRKTIKGRLNFLYTKIVAEKDFQTNKKERN